MIRVSHHPAGLRLHILGRRLHHFDFGLAALMIGAYLAWIDRHDLLNFLLYSKRDDAN